MEDVIESSRIGIPAASPRALEIAAPVDLTTAWEGFPSTHSHPVEALWTERALDAVHVTSDLMTNFTPTGGVATGFGTGAGLVAVAALLTAPHDLTSDQWQNRLKGVGTLAMGIDSGVASFSLLNAGAVGPVLQGLGRACGVTHGAVEVAEGVIQMRLARHDQSKARMAQGMFSVGMGVGCVAAGMVSWSPSIAIMLGTGVLACLVGKEIAASWDHGSQPQAA